MSDICDMAAARMEQEEGLQQLARDRRREQAISSASDECVECEAPIPEERQQATGGTDKCVTCAGLQEEFDKYWG